MKKTRRQDYGHRSRVRISKYRSPEFQPKMESVVYLVAAWVSTMETKGDESVTDCLYACLHRRREKKSMGSSSLIWTNRCWKEMSEEWQKIPDGEKKKALPCDQKMCPAERFKYRGGLLLQDEATNTPVSTSPK